MIKTFMFRTKYIIAVAEPLQFVSNRCYHILHYYHTVSLPPVILLLFIFDDKLVYQYRLLTFIL